MANIPGSLRRLTIAARPSRSEGAIRLENADTQAPELHNFTVMPQEFTPNQDSIRDRVSISYYLTKDAERVQVYLRRLRAMRASERSSIPWPRIREIHLGAGPGRVSRLRL